MLKPGLPRSLSTKEPTCQCKRPRFDSWFEEIPWRREWQPTPVFLPGEFHGQRSLVGYSPWGCKELEKTEQHSFTFTHTHQADVKQCVHVKSLRLCLTLCDPMDCSPPDFSVHGILQAGILEWGAMPSSRGSSRPRDQTRISYVTGDSLPLIYLGSPPRM